VAFCDTTPNSGPVGDDPQPVHLNEDEDIRIEYHPRSGHATKFLKLNDYRQSVPDADVVADPEPWFPFHTREDFEFAEITLEAGMTRKQSNALIKLFHRCIKGEGKFTISSHGDMANKFKAAANRLTKVS
jgi:hypothetical protein